MASFWKRHHFNLFIDIEPSYLFDKRCKNCLELKKMGRFHKLSKLTAPPFLRSNFCIISSHHVLLYDELTNFFYYLPINNVADLSLIICIHKYHGQLFCYRVSTRLQCPSRGQISCNLSPMGQ